MIRDHFNDFNNSWIGSNNIEVFVGPWNHSHNISEAPFQNHDFTFSHIGYYRAEIIPKKIEFGFSLEISI